MRAPLDPGEVEGPSGTIDKAKSGTLGAYAAPLGPGLLAQCSDPRFCGNFCYMWEEFALSGHVIVIRQ